MRKIVLTKLRNLVTCLDYDIIFSSLSFRYHIAWEVRQKNYKRVKFGIVLLRLGLDFA